MRERAVVPHTVGDHLGLHMRRLSRNTCDPSSQCVVLQCLPRTCLADERQRDLPCLGKWVRAGTELEPLIGIVIALHADDPLLVPDAHAAEEFDLHIECPDWLTQSNEQAAQQQQYAVRWEGGDNDVDVYSAADVYDAMIPCTASGAPLFARVLHGERKGELGLIIACTATRVRLRFQAEYEEEAGRIVSAEARRPAVRYEVYRRSDKTLRLELYEYVGEGGVGLTAIDPFLTSVFFELELHHVLQQWPQHAATACMLLDDSMTEEQAKSLVSASVLHTVRDVDFEGAVSSVERSVLGDWSFRVDFDIDGDHTHFRACELLERLDWSRLHSRTQVPWASATTLPPTPLPAPRPSARPSPVTPNAIEGMTRQQRLAAAKARLRERGASPGTAQSSQSAPHAHPVVQLPEPPAPERRQARYMPQRVFNDLIDLVEEGQDTRYSKEFRSANPQKPRTFATAEAAADAGWGAQSKQVGDFRPRWKVFTTESSNRLLAIVDRFAAVKSSSLATYTSSRAGYEQFCAAMRPPLVPYPLIARNVGSWLLARWMKPRKSNLSNMKPLVSALTYHTVHTLELSLDVRPYPGMAHLERDRLGRIMIAIAEMEDLALRRSIPLTLQLQRLAVQEKIVDLPAFDTHTLTPTQACAVRDVAMYGLARTCMLRKDDMVKGKLRVALYRSLGEGTNAGRLLVAPGKSHRTDVWAELPGAPDEQLKGDWTDWLLPGVAMERWLAHYRAISGGSLAPDAPLFCELSALGTPTNTHFAPTALLVEVRRWATVLGFKPHFVERLTVHGFRSGGCSDAINSGKMTKEKIQKQGRWSGPTYEMYVHLAASIVRESLRESVTTAMRTPAELRAHASSAKSREAAYLVDLLG